MRNRWPIAPLTLGEIGLIPFMWIAVFGVTLLAEKTTLSTGEMAVWPADAMALAFMLGPMRRRPILALMVCRIAAQAVSMYVGFPVLLGIILNIESTLSVIALYLLLRNKDVELYSSLKLLRVFLSSASVCYMTALIQCLTIYEAISVNIIKIILSNFCSNFIAYIILLPCMLIMHDYFKYGRTTIRNVYRAFLAVLGYVACLYFISDSYYPLLFLVPLGLMALAFTTDLGSVACGVLITGLLITAATVSGKGAIAATPGTPSTHLLMLQLFLAIITMSVLPMAARMSEHRRLREGLVEARVQAEAANVAKSQFLATISHEIRTPLNGVLGMAQIMGMSDLDPEQKDRLNVIRRSGEVLMAILNDVLDLSKIEAGKLTLERIDFDLGEILRAATHAYEPLIKDKGLTFSEDLESIDGIYQGDPTRIRQILSNLLSNALKFTETGEIRVLADYAGGSLRLTVADTGIGIPPEQLDKIFAKFTQANGTTTRRFGGTGLGLSICRDLAVLMGGDIAAQSQEGKGSTFVATIPLLRIGDTTAAQPDEPEADAAFDANLRILAAEDNPTNQLVLRTLLEMVGYEVSIAADGAAAISLWENEDWDVILMDIQMPVMDGRDAARAIRMREAATGRPRTPIIALTANMMAHQVQDYRADGMDGHVAKPIVAETLLQAILNATQPASNSQAA